MVGDILEILISYTNKEMCLIMSIKKRNTIINAIKSNKTQVKK